MAYSDFTPEFRVQEAQDATAFRVWDMSTWNGESGNTTVCILTLFHHAKDGTITEYDPYELIVGADKTKFNEYLDIDGHIVEITDLYIDGASAGDRFIDGYYVIRIEYDEGSYGAGNRPYYDNHQAFLAEKRCQIRKLPAKLSWPMTEAVRLANYDLLLIRMFVDAAEDSADLGKKTEFNNFIDLLNEMLDYYSIDECF